MNVVELVGGFLSGVWELFSQTPVPGLGISFASLYLGAFVVMISIVILRPLLGIGSSIVHSRSSTNRAKSIARHISGDDQ